jgi:hypothetical protein
LPGLASTLESPASTIYTFFFYHNGNTFSVSCEQSMCKKTISYCQSLENNTKVRVSEAKFLSDILWTPRSPPRQAIELELLFYEWVIETRTNFF